MILGIDATNIRTGGGLTHLKEILLNGNPIAHGFEKVIVWSSDSTLNHLPQIDWLIKQSHLFLNKGFIFSFVYQKMILSKCAETKYCCDVLFVPGGTFLGTFGNVVSMSQNMLPFEKKERMRYPSVLTRLKFYILKYTQSRTFKNSNGIIFLSKYAHDYVNKRINLQNNSKIIIPHGINPLFLNKPKEQRDIASYSIDFPFRFLYVSNITVYKHQWNVAAAILKIRSEGFPVVLDLVGVATLESFKKLRRIMDDDRYKCINYLGFKSNYELNAIYNNADAFVFASSCENMPIILIEAMASGLPIACSNYGPMPEVLGNLDFYFDPLKTDEIYLSIKRLLASKEDRVQYSWQAYRNASQYTWQDCSNETFKYLSLISNKFKNEY
jgi:glycosyltransferase involved in cell wall biosynthesis